MSRQKFEKTFNAFTKGLLTEASELIVTEDSSLCEKNFFLYRDCGRGQLSSYYAVDYAAQR